MQIEIRQYRESDWSQLWSIIEPIFRAGDTYAYPPEISEKEAYKAWIQTPQKTYIATNADKNIVATYFIRQNQPGLGSHVCNCGYIVAINSRGRGIASIMYEHSQNEAINMGFKAMQFNLVVSTNVDAIRLWRKKGFNIVGVLKNAFNIKRSNYVDAIIMYKQFNT